MLCLFDQLSPTFFGELRYGHANKGAVVGGIHSKVGVANCSLDSAQLIGFIRLYHD